MKKQNEVGVAVGRFQVMKLHDGHKHLIDTVFELCEKVLIVVGNSRGVACKTNPLDFETRRTMIQAEYPEAKIVELHDHPSDVEWSRQLDELIETGFPGERVILFGSRDNFFPFYRGENSCEEVDEIPNISATKTREELLLVEPKGSEDFRAGVMYASTRNFFPTSFQVVDMVIRHSQEGKVIVGRKTGEEKWRFPGGFVDPTDNGLEHAVRREASEEVGDIEIDDIKYIGSFRIDDHRYRRSVHKIMSALFVATHIYGLPLAGDDLQEVRWQDIEGLVGCMIPEHRVLAEAFVETVNRTTK